MTLLAFTVPGDPIPKARARVVRGHAFTPKRTEAYELRVRKAASDAIKHIAKAGIAWPTDARYEVSIVAHRRTAHAFDVDNLAKSVCDGVQGVVFANDSQVDHLTIARAAVDRSSPRLVVTVRAMTPAQSAAVALAVEQCMTEGE